MRKLSSSVLLAGLGLGSTCFAARELVLGGSFFNESFSLAGKPNDINVGSRTVYDIEIINRSSFPQTGTVELLPSSRFGLDSTAGITQRKIRLSLCANGANQTQLSDLPDSSSPVVLPAAPARWGLAANSNTTLRLVARFSGFSDVPSRKFITTFGPVVKITVNEDRGAIQAVPFLLFATPNGVNCDGSTDAAVDPVPTPVTTSYPTHAINGGRPF